MNNTNTNAAMTVTGTKSALAKLAKKVGGVIQTNARNGALVVEVPCVNPGLNLWADARTDGTVAYRTVDGTCHVAETQAAFLAKCRGFMPVCPDSRGRLNELRLLIESDRSVSLRR